MLVVHHEGLRTLAMQAAALLATVPHVFDAAPSARVASAAGIARTVRAASATGTHASVLVHDFAPDADASVRWLDALVTDEPSLGVLALLGAPADAALHLLVGHPHRFACVDVVLAREVTPRALAPRLAEAGRSVRHAAVARALATRWPLDALLLALARQSLDQVEGSHRAGGGDGGWPTLDALLRSAGVARRTFVRHATRAGFHPPMRFLQVVRVLGVAAAVHRGESTAAAALRFGYGSPDTMRRHFSTLAGLSPRDARHLDVRDLIDRMRDGTGG